ncbi:MAG: nucleotidyltransferase domain-containing protein [Halanaerobiales bacterium]|nr:nucleotidyltransferase domain-containing protein [Halanaerobiales bacterium]
MDKNKTMIDKLITNFIEALKRNISVDKIILYGSWAKGNTHEYSDIDLAVFSPNFGHSRLKELQFLSKVAWNIDASIEAIPYSSDKLSINDPATFVYEILHTGITVYDETSKH